MNKGPTIAYLAEQSAHKIAFFNAVTEHFGHGHSLPSWPVSLCGYPETQERAMDCLKRAKKQPRSAIGRAIKLAFLKGRYNWARRWFSNQPETVAMCWQGLTGARRAFMEGARDAGAKTLFAELAPLPGYRTLDPKGVNEENSIPRIPSYYAGVAPDPVLLSKIRESFVARAPRRRDVEQNADPVPQGAHFLFVPLQVPDDSQLLLFSGWCNGLEGFLEALAHASKFLPQGWYLRLKEHPSARQSAKDIIARHIAEGARFELDNSRDSLAQLEASEGVLTINGSLGLQALFFDKPVIVTGKAFYAFEGVARQVLSVDELVRVLSKLGDDAKPAAQILPFDAALRARFLTWLARDYYIRFDGRSLHVNGALRKVAAAIESERNP